MSAQLYQSGHLSGAGHVGPPHVMGYSRADRVDGPAESYEEEKTDQDIVDKYLGARMPSAYPDNPRLRVFDSEPESLRGSAHLLPSVIVTMKSFFGEDIEFWTHAFQLTRVKERMVEQQVTTIMNTFLDRATDLVPATTVGLMHKKIRTSLEMYAKSAFCSLAYLRAAGGQGKRELDMKLGGIMTGFRAKYLEACVSALLVAAEESSSINPLYGSRRGTMTGLQGLRRRAESFALLQRDQGVLEAYSRLTMELSMTAVSTQEVTDSFHGHAEGSSNRGYYMIVHPDIRKIILASDNSSVRPRVVYIPYINDQNTGPTAIGVYNILSGIVNFLPGEVEVHPADLLVRGASHTLRLFDFRNRNFAILHAREMMRNSGLFENGRVLSPQGRQFVQEVTGDNNPTVRQYLESTGIWDRLMDSDGELTRQPVTAYLRGEGGRPAPRSAAGGLRVSPAGLNQVLRGLGGLTVALAMAEQRAYTDNQAATQDAVNRIGQLVADILRQSQESMLRTHWHLKNHGDPVGTLVSACIKFYNDGNVDALEEAVLGQRTLGNWDLLEDKFVSAYDFGQRGDGTIAADDTSESGTTPADMPCSTHLGQLASIWAAMPGAPRMFGFLLFRQLEITVSDAYGVSLDGGPLGKLFVRPMPTTAGINSVNGTLNITVKGYVAAAVDAAQRLSRVPAAVVHGIQSGGSIEMLPFRKAVQWYRRRDTRGKIVVIPVRPDRPQAWFQRAFSVDATDDDDCLSLMRDAPETIPWVAGLHIRQGQRSSHGDVDLAMVPGYWMTSAQAYMSASMPNNSDGNGPYNCRIVGQSETSNMCVETPYGQSAPGIGTNGFVGAYTNTPGIRV